MLRIALFYGQRQAVHFLAYLDAKRAGAELVKHQALALQVHGALCSRRALDGAGPRQALFEQHDGAEHDAQGSEECTDDGFHRCLKFFKKRLNRGEDTAYIALRVFNVVLLISDVALGNGSGFVFENRHGCIHRVKTQSTVKVFFAGDGVKNDFLMVL